MPSEQLSGWIEAGISAMVGGTTAVVGLMAIAWRAGSRNNQIDEEISAAKSAMRDELHELRLYIDAQDAASRHTSANLMQREASANEANFDKVLAKLDKLLEKLEYHERHDDDRFGQVVKQIGDLTVRIAVKEAQDLRAPKS